MIFIERQSASPLYFQIYEQLKQEISEGVLKEGQILTGSRMLAKTLKVSRNTVDHAYEQLVAEGYLTPKRGIGYAVERLPQIRRTCQHGNSVRCHCEKKQAATVLYDLTNSQHTTDLFPARLWRKYTLECLDSPEYEISSWQDKQGAPYLQRQLLPYLKRIRGVTCQENQIIITCGLQQSLDYICRLLPLCPLILMEEPGYNKALAVFQNNRLKVKTVPVDPWGLSVSKLPDTKKGCMVYTTPSHQFPTGVTLPIGRRYQLLKWAADHDAYILEDDFDSEQRYYARPIPALQSIDTQGRVIYLGTFSKALSPSMRMGYMILPESLTEAYNRVFKDYNSTVPLLNQYVIGRLLETGNYERHVRRLNHVFRKRLELFLEEFSSVRDKIRLGSNGTGQYFLLEFKENTCQEELIQLALEQGVRVYSTMEFWQDKAACPPNTLFLGFSKISLEDIPDCAARLKKAWKKWLEA